MTPILTEVSAPIRSKSRPLTPDEFLTTKELMRLLKIKHKQTVYRLIDEGLPAVIVGKNFRFIRNEVIGFLKKNAKDKNSNRAKGIGR